MRCCLRRRRTDNVADAHLGHVAPLPAAPTGALHRLPQRGQVKRIMGGMIGAFAAFGVNLELAVLAVLSYRAISFWLPTLPGAIAYFQLRRTVAHWREADREELAACVSAFPNQRRQLVAPMRTHHRVPRAQHAAPRQEIVARRKSGHRTKLR